MRVRYRSSGVTRRNPDYGPIGTFPEPSPAVAPGRSTDENGAGLEDRSGTLPSRAHPANFDREEDEWPRQDSNLLPRD